VRPSLLRDLQNDFPLLVELHVVDLILQTRAKVGDGPRIGAKSRWEVGSRGSADLGITVAFSPHPQQQPLAGEVQPRWTDLAFFARRFPKAPPRSLGLNLCSFCFTWSFFENQTFFAVLLKSIPSSSNECLSKLHVSIGDVWWGLWARLFWLG
jgi:hypothetical protein